MLAATATDAIAISTAVTQPVTNQSINQSINQSFLIQAMRPITNTHDKNDLQTTNIKSMNQSVIF